MGRWRWCVWPSLLELSRLLLPVSALREQLTCGMTVCVHLGGCMGQHTTSPVRSLSCSLAEWRLAAADAVGTAAVVGLSRLGVCGDRGVTGVCGVSLLLCGCCFCCCCCRSLSDQAIDVRNGCVCALGWVHGLTYRVSGKVVVLLGVGAEIGGGGGGGGRRQWDLRALWL